MFGHKISLFGHETTKFGEPFFFFGSLLAFYHKEAESRGATIEPIMVLGNFNMKQKALLLFGKPSCESSSCHAKQRPEEAKEGRWGESKGISCRNRIILYNTKNVPT